MQTRKLIPNKAFGMAVVIVIVALLVMGFVMLLSYTSSEVNASVPPPEENLTSLRVYGECNVTYPTQSCTDAMDFIYSNAIDPFDPGVIAEDSVTFNPAYLNFQYLNAESSDNAITVDGQDSDEKVYLRMFYEPCYNHSVDELMKKIYTTGLNPLDMKDGAVVMEYTYMLLHANGTARIGHGNPDNPVSYTHLTLPTICSV